MAEPSNPPDSALAADWLTIWQSEWAAVAVDQEIREAWLRTTAAKAGAAPFPQAPDDAAPNDAAPDAPAPGSARPVPPARASAAADAPDSRDAVIARLLDRVAELERRAARAADPAGR